MEPTLDVKDRERFLQQMYDLTDGDTERILPTFDIAGRLGIPHDQAVLIAERLHTGMPGSANHGLLEPTGEDYLEVRLTPAGVEFLEQWDASVA